MIGKWSDLQTRVHISWRASAFLSRDTLEQLYSYGFSISEKNIHATMSLRSPLLELTALTEVQQRRRKSRP